jgi:hypothetical protein
MEEVNEASLEHFIESNQEDVTEFFIEEEEENPAESESLDETKEPSLRKKLALVTGVGCLW